MRPVISFGAASVLSLLALVAACGGATDTEVTGASPDGGQSSSGASGSSSGTSGSSSGTSGSSGDVDAGGDAAPAESPFTGAPAYVPTLGRNTLKGEHPNGGNPSTRACFDCHGGKGPGPDFFAAGSVFSDAKGTTPAARIEIRLRDGAGNAVSTYSDTLGNFVVTAATAANAGVTFPLHSGARNAAMTNLMSAAAPNGDCNNSSCHGGTQGWIHVP